MIDVSPHYRLGPPGTPPLPGGTTLLLEAGKGFGDGRHETTQLCLLALAYLMRVVPRPVRMPDFGAGNGVLSIAAACAGATVDAVEIDATALSEARHNAHLNNVAERIDLREALGSPETRYDVVVANIQLGVLLAHAPVLASGLAPAGHLVLSGLVSTDVPAIFAEYRPRLPGHRAEVYERGEWRAIVFSPSKS